MSEAAIDAEIRWCLRNLVSFYSVYSGDGLPGLFRSMFPDSTIAEKIYLQKYKYAYSINYGIASNFCSILMNNVKDSQFFAVSFDKCLNTVIQIRQMDLNVNFWDNVVNNVCTRYLSSTFAGHVRHQDLFEHFVSALDSLDLKSCYRYLWMVSMWIWPFSQSYTIIGQKMTWVSYFQLDHTVSMLFMETQQIFKNLASNFARLSS